MKIVWSGNFDMSGFGRAAFDYVTALNKIGVDIKIINNSTPGLKLVKSSLNTKQIEVKTIQKDEIHVQHVPPRDFIKTDAAVNIGYTTFESPVLLDEWVQKLDLMDGIIVPSSFNRDVLIEAGINSKKIHIVPHIVTYLNLNPSKVEPFIIRNKRKFCFLSIIDFTYRKGWDVLLKSYWTEFRPDEDVSMILKTYHRSFGKEDRQKVKGYIDDLKRQLRLKETPHTMIYDWPIHDDLLPSLYRSSNAYIFPSRGEGFSLTCAEAMALEVPVIATHFGGHLDYMNYENSQLIRNTGLQTMTEEQLNLSPHYESLPLAQPSMEHLRELMRKTYIHYDDALEKAKKGRKDIENKFSQISVGLLLLETIEKIARS